jgi:hypothetical protein
VSIVRRHDISVHAIVADPIAQQYGAKR